MMSGGVGKSGSSNDAFYFSFGNMAEIDEQAGPETCRLEMIVKFGAVLVDQLGDSFQFHDDRVVANQVRDVILPQKMIVVL